MNDKEIIEQLEKEYSDFAYIVSHDLKAPLRGISNIVQWIEDDFGDDVNDDIKDNFKLLTGRVTKMNQMIDALTKLSRVNRRDIDVVSVNLVPFLHELKENIGSQYPHLNLHIESEELQFNTYENKLYHVLEECLINACIHNPDASNLEVTLKTHTDKNNLIINIKDNGRGFSDSLKSEVFKLFYTEEPKDRSRTVGAGLTIIKNICNFVGGEINIPSSEAGVEILIKWPINNK